MPYVKKKYFLRQGNYTVKVNNEEVLNSAGTCSKWNNGKTRTMSEICSKVIIKKLERRQLPLSDVFIVYFEQISHIVLVFELLTLNK